MLRLARQRPEDLLHFLTLPCCPEPSRARTPESVAWLPHDVAVHREFSFQGLPMCICRSGGTASPPDLLDSNTSTCNPFSSETSAFHQLPDPLVETDKSTIRVTILSRTASGATS